MLRLHPSVSRGKDVHPKLWIHTSASKIQNVYKLSQLTLTSVEGRQTEQNSTQISQVDQHVPT